MKPENPFYLKLETATEHSHVEVTTPDDEYWHYTLLVRDGVRMAGVRLTRDEMIWLTYIMLLKLGKYEAALTMGVTNENND